MHPEIIFLIENLCKFLSKRASLWDSRFSTPSLHFDLGKQTISQDALGGVFALISAHLHRQCFLYLSICFRTFLCILKVHKLKVGKAENTTFVIPLFFFTTSSLVFSHPADHSPLAWSPLVEPNPGKGAKRLRPSGRWVPSPFPFPAQPDHYLALVGCLEN
jgi:hypothetical protein